VSNVLKKIHLNSRHLLTVAFFFLLDQLSKFIVVKFLAPHHSVKVLSFLHLTYVTNTGTIWGLFPEKNILFIIIIIAIIFLLVFFLREHVDNTFAVLLILSGALGNLFDRIFRGGVVDFIDLGFWPVFNLADSYVTIGIVVLLIQNIFHRRDIKKFT
jgi:signal peptidase II